MDKRVAPDKEGAMEKQCIRKGTLLLISNRSRRSSLSRFRQVRLEERNCDLKPGRWCVIRVRPSIYVVSYQGNFQLRRPILLLRTPSGARQRRL